MAPASSGGGELPNGVQYDPHTSDGYSRISLIVIPSPIWLRPRRLQRHRRQRRLESHVRQSWHRSRRHHRQHIQPRRLLRMHLDIPRWRETRETTLHVDCHAVDRMPTPFSDTTPRYLLTKPFRSLVQSYNALPTPSPKS